MNYDYRLGQLEQAVASLITEKAELQQEVARLMMAVATLAQQVRQLEVRQDRGPDPRLWAGDAHDPPSWRR